MRWSEKQLEAHLKQHEKRKSESVAQLKTKNDAKVRERKQNTLEANTERNTTGEEKEILNCEIASTPPTVNHYWQRAGRGYKLSDRARDFHELVALSVPQLFTTSRLKLDVTFHFPNNQRRDIDNFLKATIDSLVKCGLCVDDEQFDVLIVRRGNVVKGGLIKLKVLEI